MQIVWMISPALGARQDMINFHYLEREVGIAPDAYPFLLTIEPVTVRPVVRQNAKIVADGRHVQRNRAKQAAASSIPSLAIIFVGSNSVVGRV